MVSESSSVPSTPSSNPDFIDVERFFTREKAKPRALYPAESIPAISRHVYHLIHHAIRAALRNAFNRQAYVDAIIGLVTRRRVAFSMVEWDELKDLALACNPAIEDSLITSRRTVMRYISANYELYADHLAQSLQSAVSMIRISSDLWTSPHRHGMLAVCGQWVDKDYGLRKALLGLLECPKDHSGKSQAGLIADVLKRFGIRRVGYHTGDNATSNNTCLEALSEKLFNEREIIFDPVRRRIRCFGHIINLSLQAFLLARSKALQAALHATGDVAGAQSVETFSAASVRVHLLHQIFRWIKHWKRTMGDSKETEMLAE
ncbi:hypothetical protein FPOA_26237 [Fusarium poae]|uniref:Uncharacterized protein n=1 Tax=Fusarium poae TaxID=36050 RepID=A0A1B8AAY5_FUSPO|nr:hypothetical protein FPOA_26237 [Fusarium poae]